MSENGAKSKSGASQALQQLTQLLHRNMSVIKACFVAQPNSSKCHGQPGTQNNVKEAAVVSHWPDPFEPGRCSIHLGTEAAQAAAQPACVDRSECPTPTPSLTPQPASWHDQPLHSPVAIPPFGKPRWCCTEVRPSHGPLRILQELLDLV